MRRALIIAILVAGAACAGDDDAGDQAADWLDQWDTIDRTEEHDGATVGVDDDDQTIYVADCDAAEALTGDGGPFGPTDKPGYAYICDS